MEINKDKYYIVRGDRSGVYPKQKHPYLAQIIYILLWKIKKEKGEKA